MKKISMLLCVMLAMMHYAKAQKPITGAEYFWDTDPGQGKAHAINIGASADSVSFKATIPVTGLSNGFHNLYTRVYGDSLKWGLVEARTVFIYQNIVPAAANITNAEYFWDADPGEGAGIAINVSNSSDSVHLTSVMPTAGLAQGFHSLYVRTKNGVGNWSLVEQREVYLYQNITPTPPNIVAAEYFWDTDPGENKGTSIAVKTAADSVYLTSTMPTAGLAAGFHSLYVRTKDANNKWSLVEQREVYLYQNIQPTPPNIIAAEYFWDVDPGENKGHSIAVTKPADSVQLVPSITVNIPTGFHNLYVRSKDANQHWSLIEQRTIYVTNYPAAPQDTIDAAEYFIDSDPGQGKATPITVSKPADSISQAFVIKIPTKIDTGYHLAFVRTRDVKGFWSIVESAQFHIGNSLPITLLYFRATLNAGQTGLDWETTAEENSSLFIVQRSTDSKNFSTIATLPAAGNSATPRYYSTVDANTPFGTVYYRLVEVDKDGNSTYSLVVLIQNLTLTQPRLYPNPAHSTMHVQIPAQLNAKAIVVYDNLGRAVMQRNVADNESSFDVDVSALAQGGYHFEIISKTGNKTTISFIRE